MVGLAYNGTVIFPKYNIGDIRYFPRVYDRFHESETTDGEYTIIRRKVVFEPSVKAKEVRSIEVVVGYDRTTSIGYRMLTVGEKEDIIGTWVSEDTPEWKRIFKEDGKCYDYYNGALTNTYNYTLSTTSPQCGQVVPTGDKFTYLKLVDDKDSNFTFCYEVFSLDKTNLEIRMFNNADFLRFVRQ